MAEYLNRILSSKGMRSLIDKGHNLIDSLI